MLIIYKKQAMFIDIMFALVLGISFYLGYSKGIIKSFFAIASILIATLVTLKFSFLMINLVEKLTNMDSRYSIILGFVLCFLVVMIGIRLLGRGFEKILETAQINFINKLAGGLVSMFIGLALVSSVVWFFDKLKLIDSDTKTNSLSYSTIESFPQKSKWLLDKTKPVFSEFWDKTQEALDKMKEKEQKEKQEAQEKL